MSHFNEVANEWDSPGKVKLMNTLATKALGNMNLEKNLNILDFGCGTGLFGLEFNDYAKHITGLDTSDGMLKVFKEKVSADSEKFSFFCGELKDFKAERQYDLIVSSMAFHHLDNPSEELQRLRSLLSPKGKIAIVDLEKEDGSFHPDPEGMGVKHFGFTPEEIKSWDQHLKVELTTINEMEKDGKYFNQFLAIFSQ